jgi:hypothetical protein
LEVGAVRVSAFLAVDVRQSNVCFPRFHLTGWRRRMNEQSVYQTGNREFAMDPVRSKEERNAIATKANEVAGNTHVKEIEIVGAKQKGKTNR